MAEERVQRRLAAIVSADVVGYSRLMEQDEVGTFAALKSRRKSILEPLERTIDEIHHYFDPRLTPEAMLPWLATWVDLVLNEKWPLERRRALVRRAADLYRWQVHTSRWKNESKAVRGASHDSPRGSLSIRMPPNLCASSLDGETRLLVDIL